MGKGLPLFETGIKKLLLLRETVRGIIEPCKSDTTRYAQRACAGMEIFMENDKILEELFTFIDKSPTCFQAVDQVEKRLEQSGYLELSEKQRWKLEYGKKYYVNRNESAIIAFAIPDRQEIRGFHMVAAHSDSPCFKIKEEADLKAESCYRKWNTEKYGGMILSTWLDRPLSVAGRVVIRTSEGELEERLFQVDRDLVVIPNVAIHMNRDMNKGVEYNPQTDMLPLAGVTEQGEAFAEFLAEEMGIDAKDILGKDLFLYNRDHCTRLGLNGELICGPRLDDLECVYGALEAAATTQPQYFINMLLVFDNEEVGSGTKQGADSTFLKDVLARIRFGLELDEEQYHCMLADSFLISADNAHAVHPNHPEKADPGNRPYLNHGIVIKHHGAQKYATDARSAARMKELCTQAGVPWQVYANRSDIVGGSTLGNILMAQVSLETVDIGLPQLAMHSAYETAGADDIGYLVKALKTFYGQ